MKEKAKSRKAILLICNILLILAMITVAWIYSGHVSKVQEETKKTDFIRTIESMKTVSQNYLKGEQGYIEDWSAYICEKDMNMEETMDFLRSINTNKERFVHVVDMDTYQAYSSYYPKGEEKLGIYLEYKDANVDKYPFKKIMESMFNETDDDFKILGRYRLKETQSMGVGVGTRVTIRTDEGHKDYLMLRIIPVDILKKSWVFPAEYSTAEIGIITRSGDYVIQSKSMRSENFIEYIRGYNFQDNYNEGDKLREILRENESGILEYKNFKGIDCIWYYSAFDEGSESYILGLMSKDGLKASLDAWYIVFLVCGTLLVLMIIDGAYLISMNHRLREAARLSEQASRAKTQFLSAMSHDIRTPLNAVLGLMTIAQKKADDPKCVKDCMDKGIQSGKHLLTLINDVLDISKIESGSIALSPEIVSLPEFMQELTEMQEQALKEKRLELQTDFSELPYKYVYADKMRLNQIYVNLLTNAVKYTNSGGKIILRLYEEKISNNTENIRVVYYIEDTGIGMTEEFQRNMYRKFTREINTQVNSTQGTGLGLSIVKQMVDLMGGTITCKSVPGVGTAFTVSIDLPVMEKAEKTDTDADAEITENEVDMRLLVAEDNDLNWEIFNELISERGVICDHAENGKVCVEMLEKAPYGTYSAILMDVNMPVMNGYEATRTIRALKDEHLNKIPIIAMTADAFAEDVQACLDSGMDGHVAKPVDMTILFRYLDKIKEGKLK